MKEKKNKDLSLILSYYDKVTTKGTTLAYCLNI